MTVTMPMDIKAPAFVETLYIGSDGTAKLREGPAMPDAFETEKWTRSCKMDYRTTVDNVGGVSVTGLFCTINERSRPHPIHQEQDVEIKREPSLDSKDIKEEPDADSEDIKEEPDPDSEYIKEESDTESERKSPRPSSAKGKAKATSSDDEDRKPIKREYTPDSDSESGPDNDSPSKRRRTVGGQRVTRSTSLSNTRRNNVDFSLYHTDYTMLPSPSTDFYPREGMRSHRRGPVRQLRRELTTPLFSGDLSDFAFCAPEFLETYLALRRGSNTYELPNEHDTSVNFGTENPFNPFDEEAAPLQARSGQPLRRNMDIYGAPELEGRRGPPRNPARSTIHSRPDVPQASTSYGPPPSAASTSTRCVRFAEYLQEYPYLSMIDISSSPRVYSPDARPVRSAMRASSPASASEAGSMPSPEMQAMPGTYLNSSKRKRDSDDERDDSDSEHPAKKQFITASDMLKGYSGSVWYGVDQIFSLLGDAEPASPSHSAVNDDTVFEEADAGNVYTSHAASTGSAFAQALRGDASTSAITHTAERRLDVVPYNSASFASPALATAANEAFEAPESDVYPAPVGPAILGNSGTSASRVISASTPLSVDHSGPSCETVRRRSRRTSTASEPNTSASHSRLLRSRRRY